MKHTLHLFLTACILHLGVSASAQLSSNTNKFLGNITTRYNVDTDGFQYYKLWNQITPENESKWASIEGNRNNFNWGGCDKCYNYAKQHNFPFKLHCLIWGSQYPGWMDNLDQATQYKEIVEWMDALKKRYPDLPLIDVVNEAVPGHAPAPYKNALGGDGKTGYDWIIKAFEMAHERWPDAILIYNDYNTFQWQRQQFIDLCRVLINSGAPIDAYGCQSHDLTDMGFSAFKSAMTEIQNALQIPMYSTEYDIGTSDDQKQLQQYKDQIPYMWESDYVGGITLWGFIYGATWTTDGNSGIIRNGKDRPAMEWLRQYMASDKAKEAKGPIQFEGGYKKIASVYVKPSAMRIGVGEELTITVNARLQGKTIDHVDIYAGGELLKTCTEAPYEVSLKPSKKGALKLKAVVTATDGTEYTRPGEVTVHNPRAPYKEINLPGTLQAEDFDQGGEGISFHDSDSQNQGTTAYRTDGEGVDIVTGNGGYAIGYTANDEWLEYTVNVKQPGTYAYTAYASAGVTNSSFSIALNDDGDLKMLTDVMTVPCKTQGNWDSYGQLSGRLKMQLPEGKHVLRIIVNGGNCNIDKVTFTHVDINPDLKLGITVDPSPVVVNKATSILVEPSLPAEEISWVEIYADGTRLKRVTSSPYKVNYTPKAVGTVNIQAVAQCKDGSQSETFSQSLVVKRQRKPYGGTAAVIPGVVEAENFDVCGEGDSFHDSDSEDQGDCGYRTDNEGLDIVKSDNRYVIGYTAVNEWTEYTVNVTEAGTYSYVATVSSGTSGSSFRISRVEADGKLTTLVSKVNVPTDSNWDKYKTVSGNLSKPLEAGQQVLRFTITGASCNIDKVEFKLKVPAAVDGIETAGSTYHVYTTAGIYVGTVSGDNLAQQLYQLTGTSSLYILKDTVTGSTMKVMSNE